MFWDRFCCGINHPESRIQILVCPGMPHHCTTHIKSGRGVSLRKYLEGRGVSLREYLEGRGLSLRDYLEGRGRGGRGPCVQVPAAPVPRCAQRKNVILLSSFFLSRIILNPASTCRARTVAMRTKQPPARSSPQSLCLYRNRNTMYRELMHLEKNYNCDKH